MMFDAEEYTAYLDELFKDADRYLDNNPYSTIGDAPSFFTKVAGVSFEGRQDILAKLTVDTPIHLERDPFNLYDSNAIKVVINENDQHFGFLNRQISFILAPIMDSGITYFASISTLTGGEDGRARGVNLSIVKDESYQECFDPLMRSELQKLGDHELFARIRESVLGQHEYHIKQKEAISALLKGENTLSIFGTGRGKTCIFSTVAAYKALREEAITIIVYPLRALANDQYFSMQSMFSSMGLRVHRANGGLTSAEKGDVFRAIETGDMDILLTTPEFLLHHAAKLGPILDRIRFFVVDESHHVADTHRPAYRRLDQVVKLLGFPQVCAVTATADNDTSLLIARALDIGVMVVDDFVRTNLEIWDARGSINKEEYLLDTVRDSKSIVYVGTRKETVRLARLIRDKLPSSEHNTAFYHGGMTTTDRANIEKLFRDGMVQTIVATSAFGEGVNMPDIKDVVLYQMLFNFTQFNQQSGRAGRNGKPARVHLLFGAKDSSLNLHIVKSKAPTREQIGAIYQVLRKAPSNISNGEITEILRARKVKGINDTLVSTAIGIMDELELIERELLGNKRTITVIDRPVKKDLLHSLRYQEGQEELEDYYRFYKEILNTSGAALENFIQRPICPTYDILAKQTTKSFVYLDDLLPQVS